MPKRKTSLNRDRQSHIAALMRAAESKSQPCAYDSITWRVLDELGSRLTQGAAKDRFEVFLDSRDPAPALVCFYNLEAYRRRFRNLWLYTKAFGEICRRLKLPFDPSTANAKAWEEYLDQRPDVREKALCLMREPAFLDSFLEEAKLFAKDYMQSVDGERIKNSVIAGNKLLFVQAKENLLDAIYKSRPDWDDDRDAQSKNRSSQKIVRDFSRAHMNYKLAGRKPGAPNKPKSLAAIKKDAFLAESEFVNAMAEVLLINSGKKKSLTIRASCRQANRSPTWFYRRFNSADFERMKPAAIAAYRIKLKQQFP